MLISLRMRQTMDKAIINKPPDKPSEKLSNDVLGCTYRFILEHAFDRCNGELKQLSHNQILRGWQHMAIAPKFDEFCVITSISQTRHGTPIHNYAPNANDNSGSLGIQHLLLHNVQIDFFCNPKSGSDNRAYERAFIVAALANSTECAAIFQSYNPLISCLYSDEILNFSEIDEMHQMRHRYSVTLHLSEVKTHTMPQHFVSALGLQTNNVNQDFCEVY